MNHRTDFTETPAPARTTCADRINEHALNTTRFRVKLMEIKNNLTFYRPKELARHLAKLAFAADREAAVNMIETLEIENTTALKDT